MKKIFCLLTKRILLCLCFFNAISGYSQYTYQTTIGTQGTGNVQFNFLEGITAGPEGKIYVGDRNNDRIQILNADFTYHSEFGSSGTGNGQFNILADISIDDSGNIYAIDRGVHRLQVFNSAYEFQFQIGTTAIFGSGNNELRFPESVAVDSNNNLIYIADRGNDRVQVYDINGNYIRTIPVTYPTDIHLDSNGNIFVAALTTDIIYKFSSTGVLLNAIDGGGGSGNGQFDIPTGIALDPLDNLYVADRNNDRIAVFNSSGVWQYNITTPNASGANGFTLPTDIAIDSRGNVLLTEVVEHHFEVFKVFEVSINSAPTASSFTAANGPYENLTYTFATSVFGYSDGDGDPLSHIVISSLPAAGTLYVDADNDDSFDVGEAVSVNDQVTKADLDAGNLQYIQNGSTNTSFQFKVNDGTENSVSGYTASLNVQPVPTVTLSVSPSSASENGGTSTLTATLSNTYGTPVTVALSYSGTATAGVDYSGPSSIIVNAGSTANTGVISFVNDAIDENDETVIVDISSVINGSESGTQQITATILDDDAAPAISVNDVSVVEASGPATFTVSLSAASAKTVTVNYSTGDNTAVGPADYTSTSGTLTFNAGETSKSVNVSLKYETTDEENETFYLNLSSAVNATISDAQGIATIVNDDTPPTVTLYTRDIYNPITDESGGQAYVIAELSEVSGKTVTVPLSFSGTATGGGTDYSINNSNILISAGEVMDSIRVVSQFDGIEEGDETIIIDMDSPTNAREDGTQQVSLTIIDEDSAPPSGYSVVFDQAQINQTNQSNTSFSFSAAEVGTTYDYTISSSGGGTNVTGTGIISTASDQIPGIDVSSLGDGTLTLEATLSDTFGNTGVAATDLITKDVVAPSGYTVSFDQSQVNSSNDDNISFTFAGAEVGATYNYTISSSGGGTNVTGSGTIATATDQITGMDVSSLGDGTLTLSVKLTDTFGNTGTAATDTALKDATLPSGYSVSFDLLGETNINSINETIIEFSASGLEVGNTLNYSFESDGGGTPVTGTETVSSTSQQFDNSGAGYDLSGLADGNITLSITLTDDFLNTGSAAADTAVKNATAPSGYTVSIDPAQVNTANENSISFTFSGAEVGTIYNYTISSSGGGTNVTGTGTIATATDQISGIDVSGLGDGTLTLSVTLTDTFGNTGSAATDTAVKDATVPLGYTVSFDQAQVNLANENDISFTFSGAEVGATYNYTISSSGGGTNVTGTGTIANATNPISGIDVSGLGDGTLTLSVTLTDAFTNTSAPATDSVLKDATLPTVIVQDITVQLNAEGKVSVVEEDIDNGSNDAWGIQNISLDNKAFDCSNIGENTVTLTVTDNFGNIKTEIAIVTVEDNIVPTVLTQNITVALDENGLASITTSMIDNGSYDNCGIFEMELDILDFTCDNVGENTVRLEVKDVNGKVNSATAIVTVEDNVAPTVLTQNISVALDENGLATITPEMIDDGSSDACGLKPLRLNIMDFNCANIGGNLVELEVEDMNGNITRETATVTVQDKISPIPDLTVLGDIIVYCQLNEEDLVIPTASDNCTGSINGTHNVTFPITEEGVTPITWTYKDDSGNLVTQTQNIVIERSPLDEVVFNNETFLHDGTPKSIFVDNLPENASVTYEGNAKTDAGNYLVRAKIVYNSTNCPERILTAELIIHKAEAVITANTPQTYVYDGSIKNIEASLNHEETALTFIPSQGYTNAGAYEITIVAEKSDNYQEASKVVTLIIENADTEGVTFTDGSFIYDGTPKRVEVNGLPEDANVSYENNDRVDAGNYEVTATITRENFDDLVLTAELIINKAEAVITATTPQTFVYDGSVKNIDASLNHEETMLSYSPQQGYTNSGTYNIIVIAEETDNYLAASKEVFLVIENAEIEGATFADASFTYDGSPKHIEVEGLPEDASVSYENNDQTNAGNYEVTATITRENYDDLVLTAELIIYKAEAVITATTPQTFMYDGSEKNIDASLNHEETILSYSPQQGYTNTGTYNIIVTAEETDNYLAASKEVSLVIENAEIEGVTFADTSFEYDGTPKSIFVSNLPEGATVTYTGNDQTDAGTYTVIANVSWNNYNDAQFTAYLSITPANQVISFEALENRDLAMDGDFQLTATSSSGLPVQYSYTSTDESPAAMVSEDGMVTLLGEGQITITAYQNGNDNYQAAEEVERVLTIIDSEVVAVMDPVITIAGETYQNPAETIYYLMECGNDASEVSIEVAVASAMNVTPGRTFSINTPAPGIYSETIEILNGNSLWRTYTVIIEKQFNFSEIVEQKFNNVLLVNNNPSTNGGYRFTDFKWYRDGQYIGSGQYYSAGNRSTDRLDPSDQYYVELLTEDGQQLRTCVAVVSTQTTNQVVLAPSPVKAGSETELYTDFSDEELKGMTITISNLNGKIIKRQKSSQQMTRIQIPATAQQGVYMLRCETKNRVETIKFVIQ